MPMKDLLQRLQPVQLYIILAISIVYFLVQLFLSHITHALTLLVDSYHMLCNIIALTGCILTIKHSKKSHEQKAEPITSSTSSTNIQKFVEVPMISENAITQQHEKSLKNTFGWTRIDILTMLIVCIFLSSLSFSLLVEAIQTLVHIDHQDTMHHPIPVLITGAIGFLINGLCYILIGGYTFHQGSFLHITSSGEVILDRVVSGDSVQQGKRRLSKSKNNKIPVQYHEEPRRQNLIEYTRDICSTFFVIVCAIIIYFADDEQVSKFVDPLLSIVSCIVLMALSYPYLKESCLILLQTIPGTIDIELFKQNLLNSFSDIVNVHDLHIWQLTRNKYVSTVHILFQDPEVYTRIMNDVVNYFHEQGITIVTIQPEFNNSSPENLDCMVKCNENSCAEKYCCKEPAVSLKSLNSIKIDGDVPVSLNPSNDDSNNVKMEAAKSTQSLNSPLSKNIQQPLPITSINLRPSVSESNLSDIDENRKISELDDEFENKLNVEIADDLDKVGKIIQNSDDKTDKISDIDQHGDHDDIIDKKEKEESIILKSIS